MVKITVEVPEPLVGDIYMAVGRVLRDGQDELDEAAAGEEEDDDESVDEA
ncbi:MAG TPA: hypothetical protein VFI65_22280 [Streptosporangiaceae bacterium]|nr:hypothetical protein [Streptosporangiaceae bacterium]